MTSLYYTVNTMVADIGIQGAKALAAMVTGYIRHKYAQRWLKN